MHCSTTLTVMGLTGCSGIVGWVISFLIASPPLNYKVTIGPWIKDGFYYDFHCPDKNEVLSESDLKEIKKEIDKIIKKKLPFVREEVTR